MEAAGKVIRAGVLKLGGSMLGELLAAGPGHRGPRIPCGQGHEAEFIAYRDKVIDTALGPVTLTRAWYHCAACGHGLAPRDIELGVAGTSLSPGLTAMNDKAAAAGPFAGAAGLLEDLAGVRLTAKRVERAAEADHVRQFTIIGDGAAWIWNIATGKFPEATQIVDLFHAREHLHGLARQLEFTLLDHKDDWLAARLEDLDYGDINGICAAARVFPLEGTKKDELDTALGYFENNAPRMRCKWFRQCGLFTGSGVVEGRLQVRHRPAPQAGGHALDHRRRRRHHRPALPRGQQHLGSHLQHPAHSDTHRLTSPGPKMILVTYKNVAHPPDREIQRNVSAW